MTGSSPTSAMADRDCLAAEKEILGVYLSATRSTATAPDAGAVDVFPAQAAATTAQTLHVRLCGLATRRAAADQPKRRASHGHRDARGRTTASGGHLPQCTRSTSRWRRSTAAPDLRRNFAAQRQDAVSSPMKFSRDRRHPASQARSTSSSSSRPASSRSCRNCRP